LACGCQMFLPRNDIDICRSQGFGGEMGLRRIRNVAVKFPYLVTNVVYAINRFRGWWIFAQASSSDGFGLRSKACWAGAPHKTKSTAKCCKNGKMFVQLWFLVIWMSRSKRF
jgi:hypothetical protein